MKYFQFQMFSIFWVRLTSWFENSVMTNLVHLMLLLKLHNLHIPFFITFCIIRAAHLTFWNLTVRKTEQQAQDSLIAQVFFEISICLVIHLLTLSICLLHSFTFMVHRFLSLCNYYLLLYCHESELLQSCFPDIFLCLNVVLTLHQLFMNILKQTFFIVNF